MKLVCSLFGIMVAAGFVVVRGEEVNAFSVQQENENTRKKNFVCSEVNAFSVQQENENTRKKNFVCSEVINLILFVPNSFQLFKS